MPHPPVAQQITFLYTNNLAISARFYEQQLGLELWLDQGSCRIYRVSGDGYIGLCQGMEEIRTSTEKQTGIIFTLVTPEVDEWYDYLKQQGVEFEKPPSINPKYNIYHCFCRDPDGYLIEIQRFLQDA
jgi:catechol 2,3-dioxygenase-like lactoylglutathione lyase family enzyme